MKKYLIILVLLSISFVTSCSNKAQNNQSHLDPKNPVSITLWHYYSDKNRIALENCIKNFNETVGLKKGIIVTSIPKESILDLEKDITASVKEDIGSQAMPDIFSSYPDKAYEIDRYGKVLNLDDYFTKAEKNSFMPAFLDAGTISGKFKIVPIVKSTDLLYINDSSWKAFAVSSGHIYDDLSTWEGIYETAKDYYSYTDALTPDIKGDGKALIGIDSLANFEILGQKQLGIEAINNKKEKAVINRETLSKIYKFYAEGLAKGYICEKGKFCSDNLKTGEIISYIGSSSGAAFFPAWIEKSGEKVPISLKVLPFPKFKDSEDYVIQQGAGMCVSVSEPQRQEAAVTFLKWFTNTKNNMYFCTNSGYLPVKADIYTNNSLKDEISKMKKGDMGMQNIAKVYEIAMNQIFASKAYSVKPFSSGYKIREIFESTLIDSADSYRKLSSSLKSGGLTNEEIDIKLGENYGFDNWIETIIKEFQKNNIPYEEI